MPKIPDEWRDRQKTPIDFIVVGAGAGGAPLAARLVERGYTVLVLEMGPKNPSPPEGAKVEPTEVPLLHPSTTEDNRHSLRFFVKHFDDDPQGSRDWKVYKDGQRRDENGIFYPRAQGVGGCSIHNAMITICGPSEDWDEIAESTGDESWRGETMRGYFQRVERCHYAQPDWWGRLRAFFGFGDGWEHGRHGFKGWLDVTLTDLQFVKRDRMLLDVILGGFAAAAHYGLDRFGSLIRAAVSGRLFAGLDPNHWQTMRRGLEGISRIPVAITPNGQRSSARERLLKLQGEDSPHRSRLLLRTGFCVTGLILESDQAGRTRALGVRCLPKEHVYEADPVAQESRSFPVAEQVELHCRREVLLCGGTFNTPQLLLLSGIGPADDLQKLDIPVRADLPGVGRNLQDRYEVPVFATLTDRFRTLDGLSLSATDPDTSLRQWIDQPSKSALKRGLYSTSGGLIALFVRSKQEEVFPDLFLFAIVGTFGGYRVGYSNPDVLFPKLPDDPPDYRRTLSWLILKARTRNHDGRLRLQSRNPLQRPEINFHFFPTDTKENPDPDLESLEEGVRFVDRMLQYGEEKGVIASHTFPGSEPFGEDRREWIKHTTWGHHACGTCRMGAADDPMAVVDSRFRVRGVAGLRVVDASVFPRIPGFFLVSSVYTIAEKAADVIAEDHPILPDRLSPEVKRELIENPVHPSRPEFLARRTYPAVLERAEAQLIAARREAAGLVPSKHKPPTREGKGIGPSI